MNFNTSVNYRLSKYKEDIGYLSGISSKPYLIFREYSLLSKRIAHTVLLTWIITTIVMIDYNLRNKTSLVKRT